MSVYKSPAAILEELGITEPEDLDIEAIAQSCGATIVYERLDGCAARILGNGDQAIVIVDDRPNIGRQRFSAGHEFGHWMRDQ
jgi:Zn-dependent peptidase ImmA (M78 family)